MKEPVDEIQWEEQSLLDGSKDVLEEKISKVLRMIDCMGFPNQMSRNEWREFLQRIRDDVDERLQVVGGVTARGTR